MPLLNDNDLDRLSREAADQYDVEQGTSGWETLERRLDVELPQDRRRRRLLLWWLLAGVLLLGGALWGWKQWQGIDGKVSIAQKEQTLTESNNRKELHQEPSGTQKPTAPQPAISKPNRNDIPGLLTQTARQTGNTQAGAPKLPPVITSGPDPIQNTDEDPQLKSLTNATPLPTNTSVITYTETRQDLPDRNDSVTRSNPVQTSSFQDAPGVPGRKPTPQTSITDSTQQPATVQTTRTTANKTKPLNLSSRKNSFYLTALAGADFSNVKFSSAGRAGFNGGIQAGYYLTDRLSFNTGLIYNFKKYKARAKDFTPKGPMVYYNIDKIEGGCNMFDIPINLRYDLGIKTRSRYFVSAGVSSYLMDKEDYDYYFYTSSGNYSQKNWSTSENSNYLFSILNFSAGVEKQLGRSTYFQVEPYLKIPMKGVGNGDIRLNSFGINLGLKYQFGKK